MSEKHNLRLTLHSREGTATGLAEQLVGEVTKTLKRKQGEDNNDVPERDPNVPIGAPKWWPAPDVEDVARPLIEQYHTHLVKYNLPVLYLFAADPPQVHGRDCWGTARKVSAQNAYLYAHGQRVALKDKGHVLPSFIDEPIEGQAFFVITIWYGVWKTMTPEQRMALVDHELCHCTFKEDKEGNITAAMRGHDVEEFTEIVGRWGLWDDGLKVLFETARQEHRRHRIA